VLVPPHSPDALAKAVDLLLDDPSLAEQLGLRGFETAAAKFSISKTVRELKHLLVQLAPVPPSPAALALDPDLYAKRRSLWGSFLALFKREVASD